MNKRKVEGMGKTTVGQKVEQVPVRLGFARGVMEAAEREPRVVLLGADVTGSLGLAEFPERFPRQFISLGIAEQNIAGVAAAMAQCGLRPIFSTYATFATTRAADQIRVSICYNSAPVLIGGAHAGISVGPDGATHQALEDIAMMRALPGMSVLSPCDANEAAAAVRHLLTQGMSGPLYIRFGRAPVPNFSDVSAPFRLGCAELLHPGDDLTIAATGHMVWHALQAAQELKITGIHARVLNVHTIKPLDEETLCRCAEETGALLTAEEHQVTGGLGGAVAELLAQRCPVPMALLGMPDRFGESGDPTALMEKFQLSAEGICRAAHELLERKTKARKISR